MSFSKSHKKSRLNPSPKILTRENGASIAYHKLAGNSPGVVFMGGFMSDMNGSKAQALEKFCQTIGHEFLRYDYQGHGKSSGDFSGCTISTWVEDSLEVFNRLTNGPQVIVGSSMGGWMMILTALAFPERVAGLVGVAAAPDFTEDLIPKQLTLLQWKTIQERGSVSFPSDYDEPYIITRDLLESGKKHLVLRGEIPLTCPTRLLHGLRDESVPWETAIKVQEKLTSQDVDVILVKNGDHRLSGEIDLDRLSQIIRALL